MANVYYSVGQNTTDHSSGGNVSITSGVATFSVAQTADNLGVGDRLTAGGIVHYLAVKTSTTVWSVVNALGAASSNLGSTAVTSIAQETPASSPNGGGAITGKIIVPIGENREANVEFYAKAYDQTGNPSPSSIPVWIRIDHLPPSAPL